MYNIPCKLYSVYTMCIQCIHCTMYIYVHIRLFVMVVVYIEYRIHYQLYNVQLYGTYIQIVYIVHCMRYKVLICKSINLRLKWQMSYFIKACIRVMCILKAHHIQYTENFGSHGYIVSRIYSVTDI